MHNCSMKSETSREDEVPFGVRRGDGCQPVGTAAAFARLGRQPPTASGVRDDAIRIGRLAGDARDERDCNEWVSVCLKRRGGEGVLSQGEAWKGFRRCDGAGCSAKEAKAGASRREGREEWKESETREQSKKVELKLEKRSE